MNVTIIITGAKGAGKTQLMNKLVAVLRSYGAEPSGALIEDNEYESARFSTQDLKPGETLDQAAERWRDSR